MKKHLLLATRKGLFLYERKGKSWKFLSLSYPGIPVSMAEMDTRTNILWMAADHGHWGQKLYKSKNLGKKWEEVPAPKYPEGEIIKEGQPAILKYIWSFAFSRNNNSNRIFLGTEPGGLFFSDDEGASFQLIRGLWDHSSRKEHWFGGGRDNPGIHSILINPDNSNHILIGISCAGVFETKDGGTLWNPINKGLVASYLPDPNVEVGHDPHLLVNCKSDFSKLWQQNHCGIFNSFDGGQMWKNISQKKGPAKFGFAIAVDEKNYKTAWVIPAVSDEKRMAINGALCVCQTEDGGKTWKELSKGLPQKNCFDIVYRHGLALDEDTLVFGTTTGNVFYSFNRGKNWKCLGNYFPLVYAVRLL